MGDQGWWGDKESICQYADVEEEDGLEGGVNSEIIVHDDVRLTSITVSVL